jgi:hypothetical protein
VTPPVDFWLRIVLRFAALLAGSLPETEADRQRERDAAQKVAALRK